MAKWSAGASASMKEAVNKGYLTNDQAAGVKKKIESWADVIGKSQVKRFDVPGTRKWVEATAENHEVVRIGVNMS